MTEILLKDINTPNLTSIDVYEKTLDGYKALKVAFEKKPDEVVEMVKASGLRGRGGAGFPTGLKWSFLAKDVFPRYLACNADESEPGTCKDRELIMKNPHLLIEGMILCSYACRIETGYNYMRGEFWEYEATMDQAIEEAHAKGYLGKNIMGTGFNLDIHTHMGAGAYICGEESALLTSLEGYRGEPRLKPPFPAVEGLYGKPTVVNNVETLATLNYILENGGANWKGIGTDRSSGTKLICLDSLFNKPGIYEVEMGLPLSVLVNDLGGGFKVPVKAMQIGVPLGGLVPISKINDLTIDFESFSSNGFLLGHASIVCIPEDFPIMKFIEHLFDFAAYESCGVCFPCRLGTKRGHELSVKALNLDYKINRVLFDDLLTTLEQGSLCAHGGGIPLPVRNALDYFKPELDQYFN